MLIALSAFTAASAPTIASAHPKLVSSNPAANSTVSKPTRITLTYSEKLVAPLTGVELTMISMPGMANHKPMKVTGFKKSVGGDGKTLVVTLPRPLPAGGYNLKWHAVGGDTHRILGDLNFRVR
jgi:methionine-rich copper-binding protein CopC